MLYTSYKKDRLFSNRELALQESRRESKLEFIHEIAFVEYYKNDYGEEQTFLSTNTPSDKIDIAYQEYIKNRSTVYKVVLEKL